MSPRPPFVAGVRAAAAALLVAGCAGLATNTAEIPSGTSVEEAMERINARPLSRETIALGEQSGLEFTVLEYRFADGAGARPQRQWLMFDGNGFVGSGRGTAREARARAYDLYYASLSEHGVMSRAQGERAMLDELREIYGNDLNRSVERYLERRAAIHARVDEGQLSPDEALRKTDAALIELAGHQAAAEAAEGTERPERWQALEALGLGRQRDLGPARRALTGSGDRCWKPDDAYQTMGRCG